MTAPAPARLAISVTGLRKSFGGTVVLDGTDLAVPEGMIFALPGPNGAGTTWAGPGGAAGPPSCWPGSAWNRWPGARP